MHLRFTRRLTNRSSGARDKVPTHKSRVSSTLGGARRGTLRDNHARLLRPRRSARSFDRLLAAFTATCAVECTALPWLAMIAGPGIGTVRSPWPSLRTARPGGFEEAARRRVRFAVLSSILWGWPIAVLVFRMSLPWHKVCHESRRPSDRRFPPPKQIDRADA